MQWQRIPVDFAAMPNALAKLDRARAMLAEARTLDDVKKIRDMAEAARVLIKAAHLGRDAEYYASEISLLAAHKAGAILGELDRGKPKAKGGRTSDSPYWKTLKGSGLSYRTAQRWQEVACAPQTAVDEYFTEAREKEQDISTAGFLRAIKPKKRKRKSPYTRHISLPLTEREYDGVRKWARLAFFEDEHLKAEQRFLREALTEFFKVTGLNVEWADIFQAKAEVAEHLLRWLAQEPISESPLFKEVMAQYGVMESDIEEARAEKDRQREAMENEITIRQTEVGPVQD